MSKNNMAQKQIKIGDKATYFSPKDKSYDFTGEITHLYKDGNNEIVTCRLKGKDGIILIENLKILW